MKPKYIGSKTISRVNNMLGRKSPYKKKGKDRALQI